jgi:predicted esterase
MKNLQGFTEERWQFQALAVMDGVIRLPEAPTQVILLLHGLGERGRRIFRKLLASLPEDALIIAPNAPFPLPQVKDQRISYGFSWYFYDKFERKYFLNQDLARSWLKTLLQAKNPGKLPLTIIGFSQGGYLAPLLGTDLPETDLVIGLGCEFRHHLIEPPLRFHLESVHGIEDKTIPPQDALQEINLLQQKGISIGWHSVAETAHEISPLMAKKVKEILEHYGKRKV